MKKKVTTISIIVFFLSILTTTNNIYNQSQSENGTLKDLKEISGFYNWPGKNKPVISGFKISKDLIPSLAGTEKVSADKQPVLWNIKDGQVVKRTSRWVIGTEDYIGIDLTVAKSCEDAHEYIIERYYYSSLPFDERVPKRDTENIIGNLSFENGKKFIRNNIVVEISNEDKDNYLRKISMEIDSVLLLRPSAPSSDKLNPIIEKFEIGKTKVKVDESVKLFIEVKDPLGEGIEYLWQMSAGGIKKDELGNYYYYASKVGYQEVSLIAINYSGFTSRSNTIIKVEQITGF